MSGREYRLAGVVVPVAGAVSVCPNVAKANNKSANVPTYFIMRILFPNKAPKISFLLAGQNQFLLQRRLIFYICSPKFKATSPNPHS
jgi:hypothetical protein